MAIRTRAELNSDADTSLPDNITADIDAVHVRARVKDLADSALLAEDAGATYIAAGDITAIVALTQAAYDALDPPDASTLYVIVEA